MSESLQQQIAALAEMVGRLPARRLPGPAIGAASSAIDGPAPQRAELQDRWAELDDRLPPIEGRRVLVLGDQAVEDARAYAARGAESVTVLGSSGGSVASNGAPVSLRRLDPDTWGEELYDVVHCAHLLDRTPDPVGVLRLLRDVIRPAGTLLLAVCMLDDPERSEYLRYLPGADTLDGRTWFIPGRLAVRWMLQTTGFAVQDEFGERPGDRHGSPTVCAYLRARLIGDSSGADAERAVDALGDRVAASSMGADRDRPPSAG